MLIRLYLPVASSGFSIASFATAIGVTAGVTGESVSVAFSFGNGVAKKFYVII